MARQSIPAPCALCGCRRDLTFHHLVPRKLHRRPRYRRLFTRDEREQGILVCRPCHRGLHRLYDEETLATRFRSREAILADPALERHVSWSARQKIGAGEGA